MNMNEIFVNIAVLISAVLALSEFVDKFWDLEGVASQARSLVIGALVGTLGAYLDLGMFADPTVIGAQPDYISGPVIGLGAALMANWSFTTPFVQYLLELLKLRPPMAKTPPTPPPVA